MAPEVLALCLRPRDIGHALSQTPAAPRPRTETSVCYRQLKSCNRIQELGFAHTHARPRDFGLFPTHRCVIWITTLCDLSTLAGSYRSYLLDLYLYLWPYRHLQRPRRIQV